MERDSRPGLLLPAVASALALTLLTAPLPAQAQFFQPFWRSAPQPVQPPPPPPGYYVVPRGAPLPPGEERLRRSPQRPGSDRATTRKPKPPAAGAVPAKAAPGEAAPPPLQEGPPPPYEPQLMRLSEIMGSLAFLRELCGARDGETWRARMEALLEAEVATEPRRERLAGAFNKGYRGFEVTYRTCTPNAEIIIGRFLQEGGRITRDISTRFSGS